MKSKLQRVEDGKVSENNAIQGAQMCDCQNGMGMSFSINPHAGIHNVYFYVIGNSHLSGKQEYSVIGSFQVGAVGSDQATVLEIIISQASSTNCELLSELCSFPKMLC